MSLLSGNANAVKYSLFAFNIIFLITGIILLAVGVAVAAVYTGYEHFLSGNFFSIPTFLIVIGSFIIILTFLGCWGALKESYYIVLAYSIFLFIIFILELSAGISGYVLRNDAYKLIQTELQTSMKLYNSTTQDSVTALWDSVQRDFDCCGITKASDWGEIFSDNMLPISCCSIPVGAVGTFSCTSSIENLNLNLNPGCLDEFSKYIGDHAVSLGAAGVVIAVLQFFGVIFACFVAREIKIRNGISGVM